MYTVKTTTTLYSDNKYSLVCNNHNSINNNTHTHLQGNPGCIYTVSQKNKTFDF